MFPYISLKVLIVSSLSCIVIISSKFILMFVVLYFLCVSDLPQMFDGIWLFVFKSEVLKTSLCLGGACLMWTFL